MLVRKQIMIDENIWNDVEILNAILKDKENPKETSLSKIVSLAIKKYVEEEQINNLQFKLMKIAENNKMSREEETEILEDLSNMTPEDLEVARVIELKNK